MKIKKVRFNDEKSYFFSLYNRKVILFEKNS